MTIATQTTHTFRDIIEHLVDWAGGIGPDSQERAARRAILAAYRELWLSWEWRYFKDDRRVNLEAYYETGSVEFDLTGGTFERQLTLSDGTWPANAAYGRIEIDDIGYKVQQRKSDTVVTLSSGMCPVADIDAGTEYTWFRNEYPLGDVHRLWAMNDESGYWQHTYVTPDRWLAEERAGRIQGRPFMWTLTGGRDFFGGLGIRTSGYPEEAMTMDFIATVRPRRLVIDGVNSAWHSGTGITVTAASGTSCTVSGITFAAEVVGSLIRFSRNANVPTDVEGDNAYIDQRVITAVDDTGMILTLDDTLDFGGVAASTGFCISDPVDLPEALYDLFLRWAEYKYAQVIGDSKRLARSYELLNGKLGARLAAREWDKSVSSPSFGSGWAAEGWDVAVASITHSSNWADYLAGS